jgi:tetratricopeptide (TPR) repeat protein
MTHCDLIDGLQRLGLHALAERLLRRALRRGGRSDLEALQYRLALSLDAQGRQREAAACYAQAIDSVLAAWQTTRPAEGVQPRRPLRHHPARR